MGHKGKNKRNKQENQQQLENKQKVQKQEEQMIEKQNVDVIPPKKIQYCPICTYPFELCKYGKKAKQCRKFLQQIAPTKVSKYHPEGNEGESVEEKQQKEEVKKQKVSKKDKALKDKFIVVTVKQRAKKKFVTNVAGLQNFKIQAKQMSKKLSKKFACSCSASNSNELQVQGDFEQDIKEMLKQDYGVKKKYILDKQQFKEKETEEKQKKKADKNAEKLVIKQEPEEQEKKQEQVEEKPKYKTQFQAALAEMSDSEEQNE